MKKALSILTNSINYIKEQYFAESQNKKAKEVQFAKFINIMDVLYAVLMAWGIALVASNFIFELKHALPSVIAGLVLIRFFFAPARNLSNIAWQTQYRWLAQIGIFVIDVPLLFLHSFIYYRMCHSIWEFRYDLFYQWFFGLLAINVFWLLLILARQWWWKKDKYDQHICWGINNLFWLIIVYVLYFFKVDIFVEPNYYALFTIALLNCLFDFILTAPCYLGFKKVQLKLNSAPGSFPHL
ncbi:MAG: hypothetical protein FD145_246 [Candidatus Saganbacteria bacterium]|uniref:Uncharacterized protein n=1 Tax=Candidatus Saganbacteria bacterium TaxID=2575572 RepID=A0A833NSN0_UNCSA|nr:MAG: hypothetical protein FD145_246 [Candidatus Saganbacteria bacterium]